MTDDAAVEILAQAIWMQHFGITTIDPRWVQYATDNPTTADSLREQARGMIATSKANRNQGLGWLWS